MGVREVGFRWSTGRHGEQWSPRCTNETGHLSLRYDVGAVGYASRKYREPYLALCNALITIAIRPLSSASVHVGLSEFRDFEDRSQSCADN